MSSSRSFYGRQGTSQMTGGHMRRSSNELGLSNSLENGSSASVSSSEGAPDRGSSSSSYGRKGGSDRSSRPPSFGSKGPSTSIIIDQPMDISNISRRTEQDGVLTYLPRTWSFWTNSTKDDFDKTMVCCLVFNTSEEFVTLIHSLEESCFSSSGRAFYFSKEENRPSLQGAVFKNGNRVTLRVGTNVAKEIFTTLVAAIIGNSILYDNEGNPVLSEEDEILCCSATGKFADVSIDIWKKCAVESPRLVAWIGKILSMTFEAGNNFFYRENSR